MADHPEIIGAFTSTTSAFYSQVAAKDWQMLAEVLFRRNKQAPKGTNN